MDDVGRDDDNATLFYFFYRSIRVHFCRSFSSLWENKSLKEIFESLIVLFWSVG